MEMLDVFDKFGNHVGIRSREFCHSKNPGVFHKPTWIWIVNSKGQLLIQRRAKDVKENANKWDAPVAGHTLAGESCIDACVRETQEEIGVKVDKSEFKFVKEWINTEGWEFAQIYILMLDISEQEMRLQEKEVSQIKWVNFSEFVDLLHSSEFVQFPEDYKEWLIKTLKQQKV